MKKHLQHSISTILLLISLCSNVIVQAQVSKTANITAGGLSTILSATELSTLTNLTLTGTIDARDFKTMRDGMPLLAEIDLSSVSIFSYTGTEGTAPFPYSFYYPVNEVPNGCFFDGTTGKPKISLIKVILPLSLTSIGDQSFYECTGLTSINIPLLVTSIGNQAFWTNTKNSKISVFIPANVTIIGDYAFKGCKGPINVDESNSNFSSLDGILFNKTQTELIQCTSSKTSNYIIPFSVTLIGELAFGECGSLTSITIPSSVKSIGNMAFIRCESLSSFKILEGISPIDLSASINVFAGVNKNTCILYVPYGSKSAYLSSNQWQDFTNIIEMSDLTIKAIEVTSGGLFSALTAEELSGITKLTLTGTIDARDFKTMRDEMPLLAKIDLSGVTIVAYTGTEGTSPNSSDYPANGIPENAFFNIQTYMGKYSLNTIILPSNLNSIGNAAFDYCGGLISINIPEGVTSLGQTAFGACSNLISVTIPFSVTYISESVFWACSKLPSINIPSTVTSIGYSSFNGCTSLASIVIPSSVNSIGRWAYGDCSSLTSIHANSISPIDLSASANVFSGVDKSTCTLYVPYGSKATYMSANQWQDFANIVEMPGFILSEITADIAADQGSTVNVDIISNMSWTVSSNQTWLTISQASGHGSQTLTLTAAANPESISRNATVTVAATGVDSQIITVTQQTPSVGIFVIPVNSNHFLSYPNPFGSEINIKIQNPNRTLVIVAIYNLAGKKIKILLSGSKDELIELIWDGTNDLGLPVTPGIYICKMNNKTKQLIFTGNLRNK